MTILPWFNRLHFDQTQFKIILSFSSGFDLRHHGSLYAYSEVFPPPSFYKSTRPTHPVPSIPNSLLMVNVNTTCVSAVVLRLRLTSRLPSQMIKLASVFILGLKKPYYSHSELREAHVHFCFNYPQNTQSAYPKRALTTYTYPHFLLFATTPPPRWRLLLCTITFFLNGINDSQGMELGLNLEFCSPYYLPKYPTRLPIILNNILPATLKQHTSRPVSFIRSWQILSTMAHVVQHFWGFSCLVTNIPLYKRWFIWLSV